MKKTIIVIALSFVMLLLPLYTFAAGVDDWTNLPGYLVDGNKTPAEVSAASDGIQYSQSAGQYAMDGNYSGIIYNTPLEVDGLSLEFRIDKVAGYAGVDSWIGLHLLNKKAYFNLAVPAESQGIVTLIQFPEQGTVRFNTFEDAAAVTGKGFKDVKTEAVGTTFKVSFKKEADGTYGYYVNGEKIDAKFDGLGDIFADGKAYLVFGSSTNNSEAIKFTVTKINGKALAAAEGDSQQAEATDSNPKTGDAGMIPYVLIAGSAAVSGLMVVRRRRK